MTVNQYCSAHYYFSFSVSEKGTQDLKSQRVLGIYDGDTEVDNKSRARQYRFSLFSKSNWKGSTGHTFLGHSPQMGYTAVRIFTVSTTHYYYLPLQLTKNVIAIHIVNVF